MPEKITREDVLHVARLARLEMSEADVATFSNQIATVLDYVLMMNRLDTGGVPPTSHAISLTNAFREDEPAGHLPREAALENAPGRDEEAFIVPKIVG